jgi:hypothetical protein
MLKDSIRFAVAAPGAPPTSLEVRIRPARFGGWEAIALMHQAGDAPSLPLGRVFRSSDRRLAAGKMVAWVRRRYQHAQPHAERRSGASLAGAPDAVGRRSDWQP